MNKEKLEEILKKLRNEMIDEVDLTSERGELDRHDCQNFSIKYMDKLANEVLALLEEK